MEKRIKENSISIIVPAYNEEGYIKDAIITIHDFLIKNFNNFEIIVVDDGSSDNTYDIVLELSKQRDNLRILKNNRNYGKGYSVKKGMLSAISEYVLFTDADLSTPMNEFNKFADNLRRNADIVIGSRALKDSKILKRQNFLREKMGKTFNLFVQMFLFRNIKDTQCGFKCFRKDVAHNLFRLQKIHGFCFDAEILFIAKKLGYKIKEVPVKWVNRKQSKVSLIKSPTSMFLDIFRIWINDTLGFYNKK